MVGIYTLVSDVVNSIGEFPPTPSHKMECCMCLPEVPDTLHMHLSFGNWGGFGLVNCYESIYLKKINNCMPS